ncbi:hypothetical protein [Streptomyces silvensis]|nr:hypothetical protein [Streptomyces silvensis]
MSQPIEHVNGFPLLDAETILPAAEPPETEPDAEDDEDGTQDS